MEHTVAYKSFRPTETGPSPDVHYGTLRLPSLSSEPCAIVVNFHGGFWKPHWNLRTLHTETLLNAFGDDVRWYPFLMLRLKAATPLTA